MRQTIDHTVVCQKAQARRRRAQERWREKWPNHCRVCEANTDCGNPCPNCLLELICPRCGTEDGMHPEDAAVPCKSCGYVEGLDSGCPHGYVCQCRVAKQEQALKDLNRRLYERQQIDRDIAVLQSQIRDKRR